MPPTPSMPQTFIHKKAAILQSLSVPASSYSDKSPKGTVDDGIRELIGEINAYEGFVTTSSCAGRVSVFLEGSGRAGNGKDEVGSLSSRNANVPGGKGGGEFLFVAHEPVQISEKAGLLQQLLPGIFGQGDGGDRVSGSESWVPGERFVRFAFEPMILHVMTASLHHAKPLLGAAINSGFRESGVQSLKNLDDPKACPMVAVRTAGLGLEAIVASVMEDDEDGPGRLRDLVTKAYGTMLLRIAKERFEANQQRIGRFRACLREAMASETRKVQQNEEWESTEARRQRKRDEGLKAKKAAEIAASGDVVFKTLMSNEDDQVYLQFHPND